MMPTYMVPTRAVIVANSFRLILKDTFLVKGFFNTNAFLRHQFLQLFKEEVNQRIEIFMNAKFANIKKKYFFL